MGGRIPRRHPALRPVAAAAAALLLAAVAILGPGRSVTGVAAAGARNEATVLFGLPSQLDPALQGDVGSARVTAQLFESLTALDPGMNVRPALAASWDVLDGGRRIVFRMRDGLTFSDGSPLGAADVVRSWLRIVDPAHPSPLASLMADVEGAAAYLRGASGDPGSVGLRAVGSTVEVRLNRPATDLPAIVASPTFAVVPPGVGSRADALEAGPTFVGSGAYVLVAEKDDELTLRANERYWAGRPSIGTIHLKTTLAGGSPVDAFESGALDYTPVGDADAAWIRYDPKLGPALRAVQSLSLTYYGFDTSRPPFDDVRVRRAFAAAVDWQRIVALVSGGSASPATSMVPPGIPGRSQRDFAPVHDPSAARADLAAAGYPGGAGFPEVTLVNSGSAYDEAIVADLERELGVHVRYEAMESGPYFDRLASHPPAFWALGWVADYPGPNDFLGLLLGTASTNDYGRWSSPEFDAAIGRAAAATDPAAARAAYDEAEAIIQRDAPVIPVSYEAGYALSRDGLLGAAESGLGILRLAGLAWADR
jgi:ABC-type oligopeptide transport system substrate-binding subunit